MSQFALLLPHRRDRYAKLDEAGYVDIIKDYIAWVEDLTAKGIYQGGHKLTDTDARVLDASNGTIAAHDSPFTEATEILGGIMIIEAADYDEAEAIARTHPHLVHNSRIEIRMIHDV